MLANIIVRPGKIKICEIKIPKPFPGEILVKVRASLTCGTDLKAFLRGHPLIPMPGVFGHEFSGIVAEVGKGVRRFREGDPIMAVHTAPCLKCMFCKKGLYNLCEKIMHTKVLGAFAEYILLPSHVVRQNMFHKPKNLTFEEAAFLEPLSCVVHSVEPSGIRREDSALIIGAGPIGLLHLLLLKRKKAKVAVADIKNERLKVAKRLGADLIIKNKNSPYTETLHGGRQAGLQLRECNKSSLTPLIPPYLRGDKRGVIRGELVGLHASPLLGEVKVEGDTHVKKFTDGIGFDYVFECTGKPEVWEAAMNYVRKGGTVILFGGCESGTTVTYNTGKIHYDEITLKGVFHYTPSDVQKAYKLLCEGKLGLSRLISGRYPLQHIQKAFDKLAKGVGIKYAVIPRV